MYVTSYYESGLIGEWDSHVMSVMLHVFEILDVFVHSWNWFNEECDKVNFPY